LNGQRQGVYLLDTSVFIEAHRRYYSLSICPGFWEFLTHHCQEGRVHSIDRVRDEIAEGDALDRWVQEAPADLFASTTESAVIQAFTDMMAWVSGSPQFLQAAKDEFARVADGWIVAYARVHGMIVVSNENHRPEARSTVPIPNVCNQFGVEWNGPFEMLQFLDARFIWDR
jgi:hypothetical protein